MKTKLYNKYKNGLKKILAKRERFHFKIINEKIDGIRFRFNRWNGKFMRIANHVFDRYGQDVCDGLLKDARESID